MSHTTTATATSTSIVHSIITMSASCIHCSDNRLPCTVSAFHKSTCVECRSQCIPCVFPRPNPTISLSSHLRFNKNCSLCQHRHRSCQFSSKFDEKCTLCDHLGVDCLFQLCGEWLLLSPRQLIFCNGHL